MYEKEESLHGGNVNKVVRIGDAVYRSTKGSPYVHELLRYLEERGFEGAPRFIGIDEKGREGLSYIPGEVPGNQYPDFKPYIWTDYALIKIAELLRRYHDASEGFASTTGSPGPRPDPAESDWQEEVVCHNDAAPYNIVFQDEVPAALIDFDLAAPGPRIWDVSYTLYTSVPLAGFDIDRSTGTSVPYRKEIHAKERNRRISLFLKSYGMAVPQDLKEWTIQRLQTLCDTLTSGAAQGNEAYQKMIDEGHVTHYEQEILFLKEHFEEWFR